MLTCQRPVQKVDSSGRSFRIEALETFLGSHREIAEILSGAPGSHVVIVLHGRRSYDVQNEFELIVTDDEKTRSGGIRGFIGGLQTH